MGCATDGKSSGSSQTPVPLSRAPETPVLCPLPRAVKAGRRLLYLAIAIEQALETGDKASLDLRPPFEMSDQQRRRLDRGQPIWARLAPQSPIARRRLGPKDHPAAFQHPRIAPPQRLGLTPASVQQDDTLKGTQDRTLVRLD